MNLCHDISAHAELGSAIRAGNKVAYVVQHGQDPHAAIQYWMKQHTTDATVGVGNVNSSTARRPFVQACKLAFPGDKERIDANVQAWLDSTPTVGSFRVLIVNTLMGGDLDGVDKGRWTLTDLNTLENLGNLCVVVVVDERVWKCRHIHCFNCPTFQYQRVNAMSVSLERLKSVLRHGVKLECLPHEVLAAGFAEHIIEWTSGFDSAVTRIVTKLQTWFSAHGSMMNVKESLSDVAAEILAESKAPFVSPWNLRTDAWYLPNRKSGSNMAKELERLVLCMQKSKCYSHVIDETILSWTEDVMIMMHRHHLTTMERTVKAAHCKPINLLTWEALLKVVFPYQNSDHSI